jgi:hypothetical protein
MTDITLVDPPRIGPTLSDSFRYAQQEEVRVKPASKDSKPLGGTLRRSMVACHKRLSEDGFSILEY